MADGVLSAEHAPSSRPVCPPWAAGRVEPGRLGPQGVSPRRRARGKSRAPEAEIRSGGSDASGWTGQKRTKHFAAVRWPPHREPSAVSGQAGMIHVGAKAPRASPAARGPEGAARRVRGRLASGGRREAPSSPDPEPGRRGFGDLRPSSRGPGQGALTCTGRTWRTLPTQRGRSRTLP